MAKAITIYDGCTVAMAIIGTGIIKPLHFRVWPFAAHARCVKQRFRVLVFPSGAVSKPLCVNIASTLFVALRALKQKTSVCLC
jgi:hypothetical protein